MWHDHETYLHGDKFEYVLFFGTLPERDQVFGARFSILIFSSLSKIIWIEIITNNGMNNLIVIEAAIYPLDRSHSRIKVLNSSIMRAIT